MNNLYLYNAKYNESEVQKQCAIVFFHHVVFDFDDFLKSLDNYFETFPLPEKIVLLIPEFLEEQLKSALIDKFDDLLRVIPTKFNQQEGFDFIQPFYYNCDGILRPSPQIKLPVEESLLKQMFNHALVSIFRKRDGLMKSATAHHFVFPSGKHCDHFLRPGNILIKGNEIFFIAFNLLNKLKLDHTIIYCDTSSINSIAFSIIELKRRFLHDKFVAPYVESFGSYSAFEKNEFTFLNNSLFLVSSSTSSRIIDRLLEKKVDLKQIALIFCMGRKDGYKDNIVCDLQYNPENNEDGIKTFKSYETANSCALCKDGSITVEVTGDVFQIEKPTINLIEIKVTDAPKFHHEFIRTFHCKQSDAFNFIKAHFYEDINKDTLAQPSYEIFLDVSGLMDNIDSFPNFKERLNNFIIQYLPNKTKFIIYLPDDGSYKIALYIQDRLSCPTGDEDGIVLINQNDLFKNNLLKEYKESAAVVVVCSTMVSGSRLLYVSREMRDYGNLFLTYFIGFTRTEDESYLNFIRNNLTMGRYGLSTNPFIELERLYTPNERQNTPWVVEGQFLNNLKRWCENEDEDRFKNAINLFDERMSKLDAGYQNAGLSNFLFYRNVILEKELTINKNFAFYRFQNYKDNASQSDVYFTIAVLLNSLRNSSDHKRKIINSPFIRTLLEPNNFNRYNDGIIQAALLRAAHSSELNYGLDKKLSFSMLNIIIGLVEFSNQDHGEALVEFLYAIAIKKLRLKDYHIKELFTMIKSHKNTKENPIIEAFLEYSDKVTFSSDLEIIKEYSLKLDFS